MTAEPFDPGAIGALLGEMSEQDMQQLMGLASSLLGSAGEDAPQQPENRPPEQQQSEQNGSDAAPESPGVDLEMLSKLASMFSLLQSNTNDPRTRLLQSLRPLVGEEKQKRIDQASRMLQLIGILPQLRELGL